jgi:SRSO17 transposase
MQGLHKLRDSKKRYVYAYAVVVLAWTDGRVVIPLTYRVWKPARSRSKGKPSFDTFDGKLFHSQIALATHLLQWAKQRGFTPTAVLFDAYFLSTEVLKCLKGLEWQWVSRIKSNRNLVRDGQKYKPKQWLKRTGSTTAHLPGWGTVRLLNSPPRRDEKARHLVASNPNWGRGTIERLYGHRWAIEVLFRASKQLASLNDCQCQSWQAQHNHIALAFVAFCFLQSQCQKRETPGQALTRLQRGQVIPMPKQPPAKVRPFKWDPTLKKEKRCHDSPSTRAA